MDEKVGIIIVDDHLLIRTGFASFFMEEDRFYVAGSFENMKDVKDFAFSDKAPDFQHLIAVVDLQLGQDYSFPLIEEYSKKGIKCLVYSMYHSVAFAFKAFSCGAKGYVFKDCDRDELLFALKEVSEGKTYLPQSIQVLYSKTASVFSMFTKKEREIAESVMQGMTNNEICKNMNLTNRTVENYLSHIYEKTGVKDRLALAAFLSGKE